ncbi:abscisic acid receptor PYL12-like [Rhodamnia argentea]|uniref:Abscisic acid receptor PYL12-like n=1 Tax=Rhodamnia argentea TaxID=178133 RepID=A0A8B8QJ87_9MYRT|nr:abscisic acid receptor PYL12-like [Rhodamnia argentea]
MVRLHHTPDFLPNQCGSCLTQTVSAPLPLVWSLVRQFANPQAYKQFVRSCRVVAGDGGTAGSLREVTVVSGLPACCSRERLDLLDDELHVMVFSIVGGDHRLVNYRSTTTLHEDDREEEGEGAAGRPDDNRTTVIESYVVDVPKDSNEEDTRSFAETIIRCNLRSLAEVSEKMACALKA